MRDVCDTGLRAARALLAQDVSLARLPHDMPPTLIVSVDTEAEFDWSAPFSREATSVKSVRRLHLLQEMFDSLGVVPTFFIDHAVANDEVAVGILRELLDEGRCLVGAHLNPWITPPFEEPLTVRNSYPGNLPKDLENAKLEVLSDLISKKLNVDPRCYRAGRYGVGPNTCEILERLGYQVDSSIFPLMTYHAEGGPDFRSTTYSPFWVGGTGRLLEIPLTSAYIGLFAGQGDQIFPHLSNGIGDTFRLPAFASRFRLLEKSRLTPEGVSLSELKSLTRSLLKRGCRIFCFSYHSPSLEPGNTPYVKNQKDLEKFLHVTKRYLEFFLKDLNGVSATPLELFAMLRDCGSIERS